jgi:dTDP-4-dehydrorhamnose 3,5-epimerase
MRIHQAELSGVLVIEPEVRYEDRGFLLETYDIDKYRAAGIELPFVQDNHSSSVEGTLRGLHLQVRRPQGKLVRVLEGEIVDVAVDVRLGSPTFGRWFAVTLSAANFLQCYIPAGFAHGFCVVSARAQVVYKCTSLYDPSGEVGIAWNDPAIGIPWPIAQPMLSDRDRRNLPLHRQLDLLPVWGACGVPAGH